MSQDRERVPTPASPKRTSLASSPSPRMSPRASVAAARKKMSQPIPSRGFYSASPGAATAATGSKKTSIPTLKFHSSSDSGGCGEGGEYNGGGGGGDDATQLLETAVRKISRGSPNLQRSPGASSAASPSADPFRLEGLNGLARGYEQYRESLTAFRFPVTTEFGEASSDDLSSEWESCASDVEHNNNGGSPCPARPMTPVLETSEAAAKRALETVETANSRLAASRISECRKAAASEEEAAAAPGHGAGEDASRAPPPPQIGSSGAAAPRSESPPPRKLALPPAPAHRADQPKRVRKGKTRAVKRNKRTEGGRKRSCSVMKPLPAGKGATPDLSRTSKVLSKFSRDAKIRC